jgi:hypothetical protein
MTFFGGAMGVFGAAMVVIGVLAIAVFAGLVMLVKLVG